jgi:heptosyltransferase II
MVGAGADRATGDEVARAAHDEGYVGLIDLVGRTDLLTLMGVLAHCAAFVSNDSGAMHLAAALDVPVTAIFGPTREWATAPIAGPAGRAATIVRTDVSCRPCMLRTCPIDHRCMTGISVGGRAAECRDRRPPHGRAAVKPAVFLDRDGTLIEDHHYLASTADVTLFPWTLEALRLLSASGFALVVVTNQSGVARGFFDEASVRRIARAPGAPARRARRPGGRVLLLSAPPRRAGRGLSPRLRVPQAAARDGARGRARPRARRTGLVHGRRPVARRRARAARRCERGVLVRTGQGTDAERARPAGLEAAAVVDTLLDAARWIVARGRPAPARS